MQAGGWTSPLSAADLGHVFAHLFAPPLQAAFQGQLRATYPGAFRFLAKRVRYGWGHDLPTLLAMP